MTTLSMWASNLLGETDPVYENNVFTATPQYQLLRSMAILGANASGKSNLVKAFYAFVTAVAQSTKDERILAEYIKPFVLNTATKHEPSFFQLIFILDGAQYRYGFEATNKAIHSEWLYYTETDLLKEKKCFSREESLVKVGANFTEGKDIAKGRLFTPTELFLSVVAKHRQNGVAGKVAAYIKEIGILSGIEDESLVDLVNNFYADDKSKTQLANALALLQEADIDIVGITENVKPNTHFSATVAKLIEEGEISAPETLHFITERTVYDPQGNPTEEKYKDDFESMESEGTQQFFKFSAFLLDTLAHGKTLVVDEFDARLHPKLSRKIVSLFNNPDTNPHNAQLIFTTHNASLLNPNLLRRDQICFVEKDRFGVSSLVNLAEYMPDDGVEPLEKEYLMGRFGAVPLVENMDAALKKAFQTPPTENTK